MIIRDLIVGYRASIANGQLLSFEPDGILSQVQVNVPDASLLNHLMSMLQHPLLVVDLSVCCAPASHAADAGHFSVQSCAEGHAHALPLSLLLPLRVEQR